MRLLWGALAVALPLVAAADMRVENAAGRPIIKVDAERLVAWRDGLESVVVLAEGVGKLEMGEMPAGWRVSDVRGEGVYGFRLVGEAGAWRVIQDGKRWLVRMGSAAGPSDSALLLKDGWRVGGQRLKPKDVVVDGVRWRVAGLGRTASVAGSVVGVVEKVGGRRQEVAEAKPVEALVAVATPQAVVEETVKGLAKADRRPVPVAQMLAKIEPAAGLVPVAMPAAVAEDLSGTMAMVSTPGDVVVTAAVYVPGTVMPLVVPEHILHAKVVEPVLAPERAEEVSETAAVELEGMFPVVKGGYQDALAEQLQAVAETPEDSSAERGARMQLATFYMAWQRPEEALMVLDILPKRQDGLPRDGMARLLMGVAELAMGREPSKDVFDQKGALSGHARLWRAVALSAAEDYGVALQEWPKERGILPEYPDYIRQMAQVAQGQALVMVGDKVTARKVLDELGEGFKDGPPAAVLRLQGLVRMGTSDEREGLDLLAKAAEDTRDAVAAYRAKFEFVRALEQRNDIGDDQVRQYLTDLWMDWRGDKLERDVLGALAELYNKNNQPREALENWQMLVRAYPHIPDLNVVTEKMTQAYVNVFDPENPTTYDPLTYLGIYFDFRELLPNDARGDRVQEQMAKLLADSTLWVRAVPILEQQLDYRPLDSVAQGRLALLLAEVYRRQNKAAESLKLLDKWHKVATTSVLQRGWQIGTARALLDLQRYDSAKKAVEGLGDDTEATELRIKADWLAQNWAAAVAGLNIQLGAVPPATLVSDTAAQLAVFQMAYAYGQMKDGLGLKHLKERYAEPLAKLPQLADGVNAVAAGTGIADTSGMGGPLAPLTGALSDLNGLTDKVRITRVDLQKRREEQDEYNQKMRYMELLPPPAI